MATAQTSSEFFRSSPRAVHVGTNRMQASIASTFSQSASEEYWMFPIPAKCFVVGGAITGSQPSGATGQAIIQLGTNENRTAFGTYTISGGARTATRLAIFAPVTVSTSDDLVPYYQPVVASVLSTGATATTSLSIFVFLEYVMPGNLP